MQYIDPQREYRFSEAANLLPSPYRACGLAPETLHAWRQQGRLKAIERRFGRRTYFFVLGSELLRLLAEITHVPPNVSPRPNERAGEAATRILAERYAKARQREAERSKRPKRA